MSTRSNEAVLLAERLRNFMLEDGWTLSKQARSLTFFKPPESLGISGKYSIALPDNPEPKSNRGLIKDAADSLAQIYGYGRVGDLLSRAASLSDFSRSTRLITRFLDHSTKSGAMPLGALAAYIYNMELSLYRVAKFRLGNDRRDDMAAKQFAKDCLFLQTEVGSFVAKLEIPQTILRQADMFGEPALDSSEITVSLFSAIQFLNERILNGNNSFDSSEILSDAINLFDVDFLKSIHDAIICPEMESIDFSMELGNRVSMTSTGWMSPEKRKRLKEFVNFITDHLRGEKRIDVRGAIVELRSRDPDGNRNHIKVSADFYGDKTFITATLNNQQYQKALEAHKSKRDVRVQGSGVRLKSHIRMIEISSLDL